MAKYDPLKHFLLAKPGPRLLTTFDELADLVGGLPNSASPYSAWWANERGGRHVQADAWMRAGWRVDSLHLSGRRVTFRRGG
jgi:hypothetical protein